MTNSKKFFRPSAASLSFMVAIAAMFSSPAFAYKELAVAPSESFSAVLGNLDQELITLENDAQLLVISWSKSGTSSRYLLNWDDETILVESSEKIESFGAGSPFFLAHLRTMHALAISTEASQPGHLDLSRLAHILARITQLLQKHSQDAQAEG